jgi:hypothetical protein
MRKVFVTVLAEHDTIGRCKPLSITWEDGRIYEIDRILDVRQAASLKAGGIGIRYKCRIMGKETYLFDEEGRWFVEAKH